MVLQGLGEERGAIPAPESMASSPKRSNRLHNFTLPCLKWGSQRYLRCTNTAAASGSSSGDPRSPVSWSDDSSASRMRESEPETNQSVGARVRKPQINGGGGDGVENGIEAMREKLILDLKTKADKMKVAFLRNEEDDEKEEEEKERELTPAVTVEVAAPAEGVRTWNLRTRRAECKSPFGGGVGSGNEKGLKIDEKKPIWSSPARTDGAVKLPKLRSNCDKKTLRPKFSLQLSKKEIEEDFMKMVGHRPPRRPNKRPRAVQKQLDTLFPGMWLTEVTEDLYKVPEEAANGKARPSGKGKGKMHLAEVESDEE